MRIEVDDLNLISFGSPSPPQEFVLVGSAHDSSEAVTAGVMA